MNYNHYFYLLFKLYNKIKIIFFVTINKHYKIRFVHQLINFLESGTLGFSLMILLLGIDLLLCYNAITFILIVDSIKVIYLSLGSVHGCALFDNDKVKCWGNGKSLGRSIIESNNLGDDINELGDNLFFIDVGIGNSIKNVICGGSYLLFVKH